MEGALHKKSIANYLKIGTAGTKHKTVNLYGLSF